MAAEVNPSVSITSEMGQLRRGAVGSPGRGVVGDGGAGAAYYLDTGYGRVLAEARASLDEVDLSAIFSEEKMQNFDAAVAAVDIDWSDPDSIVRQMEAYDEVLRLKAEAATTVAGTDVRGQV